MAKQIDLTGQKFEQLTVIKPTSKRKNKYTVWECRCDCGNIIEVDTQRLKTGYAKSCGCIVAKPRKDITGQKFGRLTVISHAAELRNNEHTVWICKCDCGNIVKVNISQLTSGNTKSLLKGINSYAKGKRYRKGYI
ncbi:MAG: hypothetical protein FWC47_08235 [Oscillospiraceae bacterium]|nr:hypothetical protein [Oscillospiraceae bacterium]